MNKDLQNLMRYPEFHAFRAEAREYVESLKDDFATLSPNNASFPVEAAALNLTIKAISGFLSRLGIIEDQENRKKVITYE